MSIPESQPSSELVLQLVELSETALAARSLEEFSDKVLQSVAKTTGASSALLYVVDSRFLGPRFFQQGFQGETASKIEGVCAEQFQRFSGQTGLKLVSVPVPGNSETAAKLMLYPLQGEKTCMGLIGLVSQDDIAVTLLGLWNRFLSLISKAISVLAERIKSERELAHLNAYLTVSSMLAQLTSPTNCWKLLCSVPCRWSHLKQHPSSCLMTRRKTSHSIRSRGQPSRFWPPPYSRQTAA